MAAIAGLIPARAGNTHGISVTSTPARAHPRSRGEHKPRTTHLCSPRGSSPLARGTLLIRRDNVNDAGLIPARAGNTMNQYVFLWPEWAHPRSRGEHLDQVVVELL